MTSTQIKKPTSEALSAEPSFIFKYIWPIHRHETSRFLLTTLLMFCILFIQNLIRAEKDSIVTTMIGAEMLSFLKFWGVMPAAILMAVVYVKLISVFKPQNVFYILMSSFILFFGVFAFFIFPNHEALHLQKDASDALILSFPHFKWVILIGSKWGFSLFYIMAELWPNTVFALLFWQFVNSVTTVEESKRFYTLFGLLGQTGLYLSGQFLENLINLSNIVKNSLGLESESLTVISVQLVLSVVLVLGVIGIFTFWLLNKKITNADEIEFKAKKQKMGLKESFKMVAESRYIRLIAILLTAYGIAINLAEGPWKAKAATLYTTPEEYAVFVGSYLSYTGLFTIMFVLLGSNIVRFLGWYAAAIITPLMVFITGVAFFGFSSLDLSNILGIAIENPLTLAITMGAIQNVLSKSSKYTLFDSTKEMAYVPLEDGLKTRGKAAVDVVGIKLGKSISAFLQVTIFTLFPAATYGSISLYLMGIFSIVCIVWIWAVKELSREYDVAVKTTGH